MKKNSVLVILSVFLAAIIVFVSSCAGLGETTSERRIRRQRVVQLERRMMAEDIEDFWMTDEPSKLTDKRMP